MAELFIEILSEDVPARMQVAAGDGLRAELTKRLADAGLAADHIEIETTPRRIALVARGLPIAQPDRTEEKRGPRVGSPDQALAGFLKAAGLRDIAQADQRDTGKGVFYFATSHVPGRPAVDILGPLVIDCLRALHWPKSMRWGGARFRWVRPLRGLIALFDGKPLAGGLQIGSVTIEDGFAPQTGDGVIPFGATTSFHRFLAPATITVTGWDDYVAALPAAKVMLRRADRAAAITAGIQARAAAEGLTLIDDPGLLEEVTGLVEWPVPLLGRIDDAFMDLPPEVLTTSMRTHQKYFALAKPDGTLAPRFALAANIDTADHGAAIIAGNERVLRARLSDAKFFWDQDRKRGLENFAPALAKRVFNIHLGSDQRRVERMRDVALVIADELGIKHAEYGALSRYGIERAASLCKADLPSGMVGEFPELQGIMGRYYALHAGEDPAIADAIAEHYLPAGAGDRIPTQPLSVILALADRLVRLVGFFGIGELPTGSKDPYALRRAALGVIRIIVENGLRLPLLSLLEAVRQTHDDVTLAGAAFAEALDGQLLAFFTDRLKVELKEKGVRHDLVQAVSALREDDIVRLLARVAALQAFIGTETGADLLAGFRRATNILRIEEKKDGTSVVGHPDPARYVQDEERALAAALADAQAAVNAALLREDYTGAMTALGGLKLPVDAFFTGVMVNAPEPDLRANRLELLAALRAAFTSIADFAAIEG